MALVVDGCIRMRSTYKAIKYLVPDAELGDGPALVLVVDLRVVEVVEVLIDMGLVVAGGAAVVVPGTHWSRVHLRQSQTPIAYTARDRPCRDITYGNRGSMQCRLLPWCSLSILDIRYLRIGPRGPEMRWRS